MADTRDSKSRSRKGVRVQVPGLALFFSPIVTTRGRGGREECKRWDCQSHICRGTIVSGCVGCSAYLARSAVRSCSFSLPSSLAQDDVIAKTLRCRREWFHYGSASARAVRLSGGRFSSLVSGRFWPEVPFRTSSDLDPQSNSSYYQVSTLCEYKRMKVAFSKQCNQGGFDPRGYRFGQRSL